MREAAQHRNCIICRGDRGFNRLAIDGVEAVWIDLLEVTSRRRYVVAEVVYDTFNRAAVKEVAIRIGEL